VQDARIHPSSIALADGRPPEFRRVVSFHPRGGRLNDVQRRAFDAHAGRWYREAAQVERPLDAAAQAELFGRTAPLVLEIGSGMGESTAAMAAARPDVNLLAVEVYKPGVAQTMHHLARAGVDTVRIIRGDGVAVLTDLVPPASLAEVWLFFPDPWPKTRHLKRRLVTPGFTELVASRLARGGVFRLATDWAPYAAQMLAACAATEELRNAASGWAPRPAFRPRTRFERRGLAEGREIFDLEFVRR
jgi:tRNA (guanine-N7-)-methyltransferase